MIADDMSNYDEEGNNYGYLIFNKYSPVEIMVYINNPS